MAQTVVSDSALRTKAARAGLRLHDGLSDRTYPGRYQRVAALLRRRQRHSDQLQRFFEQVAFSVMVGDGDAPRKNFGVLHRNDRAVWLAPMFNVVTTSHYNDERYLGGPELEDRPFALKRFAGKHPPRAYPTTEALHDFGRPVCGVCQPASVVRAIAQAMTETLAAAKGEATDWRTARATLAWIRDEFAVAAKRQDRFGPARLVRIDASCIADPALARGWGWRLGRRLVEPDPGQPLGGG
jgi:serine/threonine-protein kinase HipA